jgi:hypothetical protein
LYDTKSLMGASSTGSATMYMNLMVYNLYGDPSLSVSNPPALTVTNTADSGPGSLRWAVAQLDQYGMITFDLSLPATISLTSGEIVIDKPMSIIGPGIHLLTITSNSTSRVLNVMETIAWVRYLTIHGGRAQYGGGIYNSGSLILEVMKLTGNQAVPPDFADEEAYGGAIYNTGSIQMILSEISGNSVDSEDIAYGGGIANLGDLYLSTVSVRGNTTGGWTNYGGAGIYNTGKLTFNYSSLENNSSAGHYKGKGGGLLNYGEASLFNSTISSNRVNEGSSGGGIHNEGNLSLNFCTMADNSGYFAGGISGPAVLANSLLSGNTASEGGNCGNGEITSLGYNLDSDGTCSLSGPGDLSSIDPLLGLLSGHESRPNVHPLLSGSPAVDAADPDKCYWVDQRNIPRPQGSGCDIGAYEAIQLAVSNANILEGHSGTAEMQLRVAASSRFEDGISFDYITEDGSATGQVDYIPSSGTLTILPSAAPAITVTIPVIGDLIDEPDETFNVILSNPTNAVLMVKTAQGLIIDDDTSSISMLDTVVEEGFQNHAGVFTVTIDLPNALPVQVDWTTLDGTAKAGEDYLNASGTIEFPPGSLSQVITINLLADRLLEPDEVFIIQFSNPVNAILSEEQARITIKNTKRFMLFLPVMGRNN